MIAPELALNVACFALGFTIAMTIATLNRPGVSWRRERGICRDCPSVSSCMSQDFCFGRGDALKRSK